MVRLGYKLVPVAISLALLVGAAADMLRRPKARDAEPFHARVVEASKHIPEQIGSWKGHKEDVPQEAVALLKPNVIMQRLYEDKETGQFFSLLLVQCKDARDMVGHNPPNCYPSQGWQQNECDNGAMWRDRTWEVRDRRLRLCGIPPLEWLPTITMIGREYQFSLQKGGPTQRRWVEHLIILPDPPDGRMVRDVDEINAAERKRTRRFYGAAQIQLVFNETCADEGARDRIFERIIGDPNMLNMIDALRNRGGSK